MFGFLDHISTFIPTYLATPPIQTFWEFAIFDQLDHFFTFSVAYSTTYIEMKIYLHPYQLVWSWMSSWYFCHEHHPFLVTTDDDFSLLHRKVTNNTCHKLGVYDVFNRIDPCIIHLFHAARSNVIIPKIVLHSPHFHCANITVVSPHLERIVVRVLNS